MIKRKKLLFWIINMAVPLLLGLVIYLLWTADTYVSVTVRALFRNAALPEIPLLEVNHLMSKLARNYLCDICWAYSLVFCIVPFVGLSEKQIRISVLLASLFAAAIELMQYFRFFGGTFDVLDVIVEIIACIVAGMMIKIFVWRNKK